MWHVETDVFALAVFVIMLIKNHLYRKNQNNERYDFQGKSFYLVLIFSIATNLIDIIASIAMNHATNWWVYQILMTLYVMSMPLLAAVWVSYAYVLIHQGTQGPSFQRKHTLLMLPYILYALLAASNPFTGLFFKLSPDMEYTRGILFMPVGVGMIMFYSALGYVLVMINRKRIKPAANAYLMVVFFVITAVFTWVQLAHPGWLIINACYAIVYILCDVTIEEQRRTALYNQIKTQNQELQEALERAESATHAKTEFLSRMSHDIRTPMNAIIGLTHLAKDENDMAVIKEYLYNIESASDFLLGLINDILDMSKIENGDLKLKDDVFTREEFSNSISTVIKPLMDARGINFIFKMDGDPECIKADKLRFNQIFFNLLSNASKFTESGGTVEFTSHSIPPKGDLMGLRFIVKDTGIGMSPEYMPHMYDPFSQERAKLNNSTKGTGLGLPIVKSLVDAMGGSISVKSEIGVGTEFTVDLYFAPASKEDVTSVTKPERRQNLKGAQILLVEDNDINIYVAQIILDRAGCIVTVAHNGQEAVDIFAASDPDHFEAILMDVRMPVMDGITATEVIRAMDREDARTIPIIAMTADAFEEQQKKTIEAGMTHHLSKPIDPSMLYHVLSTYLISDKT